MGPFFALENLSDVTEASNLNDKMKVVFEEARREEKGVIGVLQNLCFSMNISLSENRRLVAELELLVERGEAAKSLQQIRNIVASQTAIYGELDKVLARAFVGLSLKSGYIGYVEEEDSECRVSLLVAFVALKCRVSLRRGSLRNGYHIQGRQQARKLPNPDTGR
ncbi:hypothetical protein Tco_0716299 [Tanacetum coccineum]